VSISYDGAGNPLNWVNGISSFTWEGGRQLQSLTKSGVTSTYTYDDNGLRLSKTVAGVTTNYTWVNSQITSQETNGQYTYFRYNQSGQFMGLNWNGSEYFYVKDAMGNVIGITDSTGNLVVEYAYDEWGTCIFVTGQLSSTLGQENPFRYKGYYFDSESGLYYLQSRYYDSAIGRFINPDEPSMISQGILNLFSYGEDNPVNTIDSDGNCGITVDGKLIPDMVPITVTVGPLIIIKGAPSFYYFYSADDSHFANDAVKDQKVIMNYFGLSQSQMNLIAIYSTNDMIRDWNDRKYFRCCYLCSWESTGYEYEWR